jgi:putative ABC transport system permease protein
MHLRSLLRSLARTPGFTLAVIATIALGIGATSAMFSVVYAALLRPLPYPDPDRLAIIWETQPIEGLRHIPDPTVAARLAERSMVNSRVLPTWRDENHSFEDIAGFGPWQFNLTGTSEPERLTGLTATAQFFTVLGARPLIGHLFEPGDDQPGRDEVIVLGYGFWKRRFAGDPAVVGRTVGIDGVTHTIVGVLPESFHLVLPNVPRDPDIVTPISHRYLQGRNWTIVTVLGRMKSGVTPEGARADMAAVVRHVAASMPFYRERGANVVPLADEVRRDHRLTLLVLLGATGCILLIGCANVANLLLVRAGVRQKELAVRTALGASRGQLMRHTLAESVLLAVAGGAAGLLLARWGTALVVALMPDNLFPRIEDVHVDATVLGVGLAVSVFVGLLAGLLPAWYTLHWDRRGALNRTLSTSARGASAGRGRRLLSRALVCAQVAVAMVVLLAAALLTETYIRLTRTDLGVKPERVLTFGLVLPTARYASPPSRVAFVEALLPRLAALPGVESVGLSNSLPVASSFTGSMTVEVEGNPPASDDPRRTPSVQVRTISGDLFGAAGIRLAYGRLLAAGDLRPDVAVINRTAVRRFWPTAPPNGPEPLGRHLKFGNRVCTVVGVVNDVKYNGPAGAVWEEAYVPYAFWPMEFMSLVLRTTGEPKGLVPGARTAVRGVDPDLPLNDVSTLEEVLAETVAPPRFRFVLIGAFAVLALVLALVGLYGVISQSVAGRTQEIGIRLALGAGSWRIARMVLLEGLALAAAGIVAGLALSLASIRVLATFLYGVSGSDVNNYVAIALLIALLTLMASYGPARRAMKADPAFVLRAE